MKSGKSKLDPKHMGEYIRYFSILGGIVDRLSKQGYTFRNGKVLLPKNKDK